MSDSNQAVFLSYASQDAAAVARIAEALRASGVEVWFDQNELVGGDAWDAKIRGQIASCALFVPIISAATQARLEGYFRIEWKLAAQRTHAMAHEKAFLLPIVIDDTRDAEAKVPAEFKAVQWTKLPGGEASEKFCARVVALLGRGAVLQPALTTSEPGPKPRATPERAARRVPVAVLVGAIVAVAAVAGFFGLRPGLQTRAGSQPAATAPAVSEASRLVAKAWEQMDKTEMARNELLLAEGYCRQAAALEETNPAVWAAWSAMNTWFYFHQFERVPARKEAARDYAQKALALDPKSYDARYAWAHFVVRMAMKTGEERPALPILRELLREQPDEPRALYALGYGLIADPANADEGFALLERLADKHPWFAGRALNEVGWMALFYGRFGLAESAADRALKAQPYWNNLGLKATLALHLHGNVELAQATIDRLPPTILQENWGISLAVTVADWRGDHARAVAILEAVSRDWLENFFFLGPTSFLSGQMRLKAKQVNAAEKDFRRALELIAVRLGQSPNDPALLYYQAEAQRLLGLREEADKTYRQVREVWPDTFAPLTFEPPEKALDYVRRMVARGNGIEYVFPSGWWFSAASLRLDPLFENVRRAPGFRALLDEVEQRERSQRAVTASAAPAKTAAVELAAQAAPEKSVAVLAFRQLSADPDNEYLCEAISDELCSVLGRVPGLKVAASASAFTFKGKRVRPTEMAAQLGVAYLVDGSVQKVGPRVRVRAQLIKAADESTVWSSELLEREAKDMFALQDQVVSAIAQNLQVQLGAAPAAAITINPEAYRLYYEGRRAWSMRGTEEFAAKAQDFFRQAIAADPKLGRAYAGLADTLRNASATGGDALTYADRNSARARELEALVETALRLEPGSAEAYASRGGVFWQTWRVVEAERDLRTAIRLNPSYADAHLSLGRLLSADGRLDEAVAEIKLASELDPLSSRILDNYSGVLIEAGRYTEALAQADRALALQPDAEMAFRRKVNVLSLLGRHDEALAIAHRPDLPSILSQSVPVLVRAGQKEEAAKLYPTLDLSPRNRTVALAALERYGEALDSLQVDNANITAVGPYLYSNLLDPIRSDPRFIDYLTTLGLKAAHARAQAWRAANPPEKVAATK